MQPPIIIRVLTICYCWAFRLYKPLQSFFNNDYKEVEGFENGWHVVARDLQYIGVCLTTARCQTVIRAASRAEIAQPPESTVKFWSGKPLPRIGRDELQGLEIITISGSRTRE